MTLKFKILSFLICLSLITCKKTIGKEVARQKIDNLIKLAEIYGVVKYFHPSDEAYNLDWDKFAIYSAEEILKCENHVVHSVFTCTPKCFWLKLWVQKGVAVLHLFWELLANLT